MFKNRIRYTLLCLYTEVIYQIIRYNPTLQHSLTLNMCHLLFEQLQAVIVNVSIALMCRDAFCCVYEYAY